LAALRAFRRLASYIYMEDMCLPLRLYTRDILPPYPN